MSDETQPTTTAVDAVDVSAVVPHEESQSEGDAPAGFDQPLSDAALEAQAKILATQHDAIALARIATSAAAHAGAALTSVNEHATELLVADEEIATLKQQLADATAATSAAVDAEKAKADADNSELRTEIERLKGLLATRA